MAIDLQERLTPGYDSDGNTDPSQNGQLKDYYNYDLQSQQLIDAALNGNLKEHLKEKGRNIADLGINELRELEKALVPEGQVGKYMPEGNKMLAADVLREMEDRRRRGEEADDYKDLYQPTSLENKRGLRRLSVILDNRRKRYVASSIVLALASSISAVIGLSAGPGKLLYLSDTLEKGNFWTQEDMGAIRQFKLAMNVNYAIRSPEKLRLGLIGNIHADSLKKTMKRNGFDVEYSRRIYQNKSIVFDLDSVSENGKLGGLKADTIEEAQRTLRSEYNLDGGRIEGNRIIYDIEGSNFRSVRKQFTAIMKASGYRDVFAIRARLLTKLGGTYSMFSPIKRFDEASLKKLDAYTSTKANKAKAAFEEWRKDFQKRANGIETQEKIKVGAADEPDAPANDPDKPDKISNESVADATNDVLDGNPEPGVTADVDAKASVRSKLVNKTSGPLAVLGVICAAKSISNTIDKVRETNLVMPMMRVGMEMIAVGNQIKSNRNVDTTKLGYYSAMLGENWTNAMVLRVQQGAEDKLGQDLPDSLKYQPEKNPATQLLEAIPLAAPACDAVSSTVGTVVSTFIGASGGPVSFLVGEAFSRYVAPSIIDGFVDWTAGEAVDLAKYRDADFANIAAVGALHGANNSFKAAGASPLPTKTVLQQRNDQLALQRESFQNKSLAYRFFNMNDSSSFASKIAATTPSSMSNTASMARSLVTGSMKSISSMISGTILKKSHAEDTTPYDYGFPTLGYTYEEINNPDLDNPYQNAEEVNNLLQSSSGDDYIERAKTCFSIKLDKDGTVTALKSNSISYGTFDEHPECSDSSKEWLRIRMYIFDTQLMESMACYDGVDEQSCSNIGMSPSSTSQTGSVPSESATLPGGDSKLLAQQLLDAQKAGKIGIDKIEQVQNIAAGTSPCPSIDGGKYQVDTKLLAVLVALSQNNTFTISSLHRGCTGSTAGAGTKSRHWKGRAVDISGSRPINGATMNGSFADYNQTIQAFVNEAKKLLPDDCELGVPNQTYVNGAMAIQTGCSNVFIDSATSKTKATAPHVHLGV